MAVDILFILCFVVFFCYECNTLIDPKHFINVYDDLTNKDDQTDKIDASKATKGCLYGMLHLSYITFNIAGIAYSDHWILYLSFMMFSLLSGFIRNRIKKMSIKILQAKLDATISLCFLFMMFMYHFDRNIVELLEIMKQWV